MKQNKFIYDPVSIWQPILAQQISSEDAELQRKYEEKVEDESKKLEHPYLVALEYCGWLEDGDVKKQVQSCKPYCCFNHQMGMPRKKYEDPITGEPRESDPLEFYEYERATVANYEAHRFYAQNKVRGSGITEVLAIRHMLYKYAVVNQIKNRKYLLAAGQSRSVAVGFFRRMLDIATAYTKIIFDEMPNYANPKLLKFKSGGEAHALPSDPNAPRGLENVGDVILDEAAFWNLVDDEPVLKAFEPFVIKSGAKMGIFSTPNGQRGFFWNKIWNPEIITKYFKHLVTFEDVTNVAEPIIDVPQALKLKEDDPDLFAQEFGNQFILPSSSVFGSEFLTAQRIAEF